MAPETIAEYTFFSCSRADNQRQKYRTSKTGCATGKRSITSYPRYTGCPGNTIVRTDFQVEYSGPFETVSLSYD